MSASNGVIRIGRKGIKKFAFGDDGEPFEVDVVSAMEQWIALDQNFRQTSGDDEGKILREDVPAFHQASVDFVKGLAGEAYANVSISKAEALDFLARLAEQHAELADFFRPKKRGEDGSPASSGVELQFSEEPDHSPTSTN